MKRPALAISLVLAMLFGVWAASPAVAKPVPGIKQTQQYRVLLKFVNKLEAKRKTPAGPDRKAAYRKSLSSKTGDAKRQVKTLFNRRATRVKSRDDAEERRQVRNIRTNQKRQVQALQAVLNSKLADAQDDLNAAIRRINARFAPRLNPLVAQRKILRKRLAKAQRPARKERLRKAIREVQKQINRVVDARQASTSVVTTRYQARVEALNDVYSTRIRNVRNRSRQLVLQARRAWQQTYRVDYERLKERRSTEFSLVKRLRVRGSGYIAAMPPKR
jgi:hypothetical protein